MSNFHKVKIKGEDSLPGQNAEHLFFYGIPGGKFDFALYLRALTSTLRFDFTVQLRGSTAWVRTVAGTVNLN